MEGRWAKLTLCAHLNKFIDITKPIHPLAEELIFKYTSVIENIRFYSASPSIDDEGDLLYNKASWLIGQRDCILPKVASEKIDNTTTEELALVKQWNLLNKKDNNG